MNPSLSSLMIQVLLCLAGLALCIATQLPVYGADGDIIISRQVQPRAAARQELVPDPNPLVVNPRRDAMLNQALDAGLAPTEMSDRDFAGISSGSRFSNAFSNLPFGAGPANPVPTGGGAAGLNPAGHGGGVAGNAGGQVSRSIQQGLRPLQMLGGK
ncbi:hypothetical protein [Pseudomonas sp. FME51]|uniref:hypothetical protein n=1 Tax=Pseudomonas sp. FME51 TaxID=2742609 RepID=UPI001D0301D9|nr:hypothetical protein [Pseudomonas sp. FME51]